MDRGYFLAEKKDDGSPGRPMGDEGINAILMFDGLESAKAAKETLCDPGENLSIFQVNIVVVGEVE